MDKNLLDQIARLKIRLRQDAGQSLNTRRFFEDAAYGQAMLERAEDVDDVELVALAMQLRHRMGWLALQPARPAHDEPVAARPVSGRYLFGARS
jgi:hypothetical protein